MSLCWTDSKEGFFELVAKISSSNSGLSYRRGHRVDSFLKALAKILGWFSLALFRSYNYPQTHNWPAGGCVLIIQVWVMCLSSLELEARSDPSESWLEMVGRWFLRGPPQDIFHYSCLLVFQDPRSREWDASCTDLQMGELSLDVFCCSLTKWLWASQFPSWGLTYLICKVRNLDQVILMIPFTSKILQFSLPWLEGLL